ncbi:hypothetical protein [Pedobacter sp. Hv1]|uniref:hypothetical protein n=1 Tax=Pedobacter sp. Hv1 TaxID=1740090 RepID=UPI0006D8CE5E|nr:hypothetical protein [Pedobacter sp. Hv1]KQB98819.1 hypothetical protein AQF98_20980 [Pedobacter sp. Hv1]
MSKKRTFKKISTVLLFALILCTQYVNGQNIETSLKEQLKKYSSQKTGLDTNLKIIDLGSASVSVPSQFKNKRTGTIDSDMGELSSGDFKIFYDIGYMAGTHITDRNTRNSSYFTVGTYNGYKTYIGLRKEGDKDQLIITIWEPNQERSMPANFWAYIKSEKDINDMITIVMNFKLNKKV